MNFFAPLRLSVIYGLVYEPFLELVGHYTDTSDIQQPFHNPRLVFRLFLLAHYNDTYCRLLSLVTIIPCPE